MKHVEDFLLVVTRANTIVQPQAMMVDSYNTFVTHPAVLGGLKATIK